MPPRPPSAQRRLLAACLWSALAATRTASAAQPDPAQASFDRGLSLMDARRYDEACPAVEESYRLDPRPGTLFTLAECEAMRGRVATALARYDDYLALYPALTPQQKRKQSDREQVARKQRAALARDVPELKLVLSKDAPPDTAVERDGVAVPNAALGTLIPVDPGDHVVRARAPGGTAIELHVRLDKREKKTITLEVKASPPSAQPPPAEPRAPVTAPAEAPPKVPTARSPAQRAVPDAGVSGRRVALYAASGLGVAGLVAGGITGVLAIDRKAVIDDNCQDEACNREGKQAADSLKTFGLISTLGFGVGIVGLGAAAALLLTEPETPTSAARGRPRITLEFVPLCAGGAVAHVQGAF